MYPITHPQLKAVSDLVPKVGCLVKLHGYRYRTYPSLCGWLQSISSILPVSCNLPASLIKSLTVTPSARVGKSVMLERVFKWTSTHHEAQPGMNAPHADQLLLSPPRRRTIYLWGHPSPDVTHISGELLSTPGSETGTELGDAIPGLPTQ